MPKEKENPVKQRLLEYKIEDKKMSKDIASHINYIIDKLEPKTSDKAAEQTRQSIHSKQPTIQDLFNAAINDDVETIKLCHQYHMNLNAFDEDKCTVLMYAVINESENAVKALCELGAKVDMQNSHGTTALMYAADKHNTKIIDYLCQNKADVFITDHDNTNVLLYAINDLKTTKTLLKYIPKDHIYIGNAFCNAINFKISCQNFSMKNDYYNFVYNYIKESKFRGFLEQMGLEPANTHNTSSILPLANSRTQRRQKNMRGRRNTNLRNDQSVRPTEVNRTATTNTSAVQNSESVTPQKKSRKRKEPPCPILY